jgi:hypothetical protein
MNKDNEITEGQDKEAKKIRLPYYKLEELKKQEEKKVFKNPNKTKPQQKVEWSLPGHTLYKKKKIGMRSKEEDKKDPEEEKGIIVDKGINMDIGDKLKQLKYSIDDVVEKKLRLSKKQRRLQQAENTLASFLSKEDKQSLFGRKNTISSFNMHSPERDFYKSNSKLIDISLINQSGNNLQPVNVNIYLIRILKQKLNYLVKRKRE